MAPSGRSDDDPLLVADSVPARAARGRGAQRGDAPAGPVDPRTEAGEAPPAGRRARVVTRAASPPPAVDETPAVPLLRASDLEVPARRSERAGAVADDAVWAAAAPLTRDAPTGPVGVVEPVRVADVTITPVVAPLTGVPVPVVVPGTPHEPVASAREAPVVAAPASVKVRRKDRPKMVRLPRRARIRKVSRVVRSVDAWSVFKVSLVFYLAMYVVFLVAGVLLWNVAYSTGTIDNVSSFFESFGWESFEFKGGEIYHNAWIIGLFVVAGLTGLNVVLATLYNLITDLVGGIRLTVLEEEVLVRAAPTNDGSGRAPSTTTVKASRRDHRRAARRRTQAG